MIGRFENSGTALQGCFDLFGSALLLLLIPAVFGTWLRLISGLKVERERDEECGDDIDIVMSTARIHRERGSGECGLRAIDKSRD